MSLRTLLLAALTALSTTAGAAVHTVQLRLDAAQLQPFQLASDGAGRRIELATMDTLNVDIQFLPGQTLRLDQVLSFSLVAPGLDLTQSIDFLLDSRLNLRDASGQTVASAHGQQQSNGNALQSLFFGSQLGLPISGAIELSGLSFSAKLLSYSDGATRHFFGDPGVVLGAAGMQAITTAVPEPSALTLTLLGLGAFALRNRRRQPAR